MNFDSYTVTAAEVIADMINAGVAPADAVADVAADISDDVKFNSDIRADLRCWHDGKTDAGHAAALVRESVALTGSGLAG